jgi:hypothetical protein
MYRNQKNTASRASCRLGRLLLAALLLNASWAYAHDGDSDESRGDESKIRKGFELAPVPLNLAGKDRRLVGLGSYLVNAVSECNGCHTASLEAKYSPGGNPFFKGNQPLVINPATYLAGGRSFGSLIPGTPEIIARNLTPDKTGRPSGGLTYWQFAQTFRTGVDLDHQHPNCDGPSTATCFGTFQPFNGDLLQVMPWPEYLGMSDRHVRAIYEYLSAIPCIAGPPAPSPLHHDCTW